MNVKVKKIIAKEVLLLISALLLLLFVYLSSLVYNYFQEKSLVNNTSSFVALNKEFHTYLSRPLIPKNENITQRMLDDFFVFSMQNNDLVSIDYLYTNFKISKSDSVLKQAIYDYLATSSSNKYNFKKEQNLKFPELFLFKQSEIDSLIEFKTKLDQIKTTIDISKSNIIHHDTLNRIIFQLGILLFVLLYVVRYLFIISIWAIKTLKNKV